MYYLLIVSRSGLRASAKCLNCKLYGQLFAAACVYQGRGGSVKNDVGGLRQLALRHFNVLAPGSQSYVPVVIERTGK